MTAVGVIPARYAASRFPGNPAPDPIFPWTRSLAVGVGACWVLPKAQYLLGGPLPGTVTPGVVSGAEAVALVATMSVFVWNYRHLQEGGRRRIRWAVYRTWAAAVPLTLALRIPVFAPDFPYFSEMLAVGGLSAAVIPLGFLVAIVGYALFDVDRLVSATASYSLLVGGLLAAGVVLVPTASEWASSWLNVDAQTSRLALSAALAAAAIPAGGWLRPHMDRWFFPERQRVEEGIEALLADQAAESRAEPLAERVAAGLHELLRPRLAAVYVRRAAAFEPVGCLPESDLPRLPRRSSPSPRSSAPSSSSRSARATPCVPWWCWEPSAPATSTLRRSWRSSPPSWRPRPATSSVPRRPRPGFASGCAPRSSTASGAPPRT